MYIWASGVDVGCSREDSVFPPCLRGLYLSAQQRWWKGAVGDALQLGTAAAPSTIRAVGPGSAARLLLPQHHSGGCHSRLAGHIAKTIRCHPASQECQQHSGQLEDIHPPSLRTRLLPGRSHTHKYQHTQGATESCCIPWLTACEARRGFQHWQRTSRRIWMATYSTSALSKETKRFCNASTSHGYIQHFWLFFSPVILYVFNFLIFFIYIFSLYS